MGLETAPFLKQMIMKKTIIFLLTIWIINSSFKEGKIRITGDVKLERDFEVTLTITGQDLTSKVIARTNAKNGKFEFEFDPVSVPTRATISMLGSVRSIILENRDVRYEYSRREGDKITGGFYNNILYSWESSEKVRQINEALFNLESRSNLKNISQDSLKIFREESSKMRNEISKIHSDHLNALLGHDDNYIKLFALLELPRLSDSQMEILKNIEKSLPENYDIKLIYKRKEDARKIADASARSSVGNSMIDFNSETLEGVKIRLSDKVLKNRYTLLEAWASWCAPCRKEMKKMPPIYNRFKSHGFEIFSVSLDEKRDNWIKASAEMEIPWINSISLSGTNDDMGDLYGITSIPANFLLDNKGKIIARNISVEELEKFLLENLALLFRNPH